MMIDIVLILLLIAGFRLADLKPDFQRYWQLMQDFVNDHVITYRINSNI
ncbi:MAG: hypothetical protein ABIQ02_09240 [Saprospiraceae bacterium]